MSMNPQGSLRDTYNRIAADWHRDHKADEWWVPCTERFVAMLSADTLVLDVGCAGGTKVRYLSQRGLRVIGIDPAEQFIEIARRENPGGDFRVMSAEDIGTLEEDFDGVFVQAVLLHFPKAEAARIIKEMAAKLRPGGLLYVAVKEVRDGQPEEGVLTEADYGYPYSRFFSYYRLPEVKGYFAAAGLSVDHEEILPTGKTRWIQIIGRKTASEV